MDEDQANWYVLGRATPNATTAPAESAPAKAGDRGLDDRELAAFESHFRLTDPENLAIPIIAELRQLREANAAQREGMGPVATRIVEQLDVSEMVHNHWPDHAIIPVKITFGEARAIRAAMQPSQVEK